MWTLRHSRRNMILRSVAAAAAYHAHRQQVRLGNLIKAAPSSFKLQHQGLWNMADTSSTHALQKLRGLALLAISFQTLGVVYGDLGAQHLHLESLPVGNTSLGTQLGV